MILFLVISGLVLNGGLGAPSTAVYKFVKCSPEGDQANCITHQSADMEWSPDLPTKLPASAAQYLEAEAVEDERAQMEEDEFLQTSEEEESPTVYLPEEGSGYEGSAFMADWATPADTGSGGHNNRKDSLSQKWILLDERKPAEQEMKEDSLM